ncbi:DUF4384 domain-containing protein [Nannocystis exedens]|uniref:DUF4384 domain-containing protein n=1 Tax=Nannocystis exedens TaxID=54 RepID=UPI000BBA0241|nr:DUF4384 domain-containing protein [Nannocystis exedens]
MIDRLIVGELDDGARAEVLGHAGACAWCTARIAELRGEQQAFATGPVPLALHRPKRRFLGVSAALAAAAALALVFLPDRSGPGPEPEPALDTGDVVRTKGAAHVGLYVERDGGLSPLLSGEHIVPGARVQPTYTTSEPGHLAIFGIDGAGRVQRHYPADGPASAPVRPARDEPLPFSLAFDATPGREVLVAVFCPQAFDAAALEPRLAGGAAVEPGPRCTVDRIDLLKDVR